MSERRKGSKYHLPKYQELCRYASTEGTAADYLGIKVTDIGDGWAVGEMDLKLHHKNPIKSAHGGMIFALADTVGGTAVCSHGFTSATANGTIHFLNAAYDAKKLIAEADEIKGGRHLLTYEIKIRTEEDVPVARVIMEYYSLEKLLGKIDLD